MPLPTYERWSDTQARAETHPAIIALNRSGLHAFLSESHDDGVAVLDLHGVIVQTNQALLRRTMYQSDELIGRPFVDALTPQHRPRMVAVIDDVAKHHSVRVEAIGVKRDGSSCGLDITAIPLVNNQRDVVGSVVITRNVTENLARDVASERSEQLLSLAGRIAGFSGWSLDLRSGEMTWSASDADASHPKPATQGELMSIIEPADAARLERAIGRAAVGDRMVSTTVRMSMAAGHTRDVRLIAEQVRDDRGAIIALSGAAHDVTEVVEREDAMRRAERMDSLGSFASGIAHDLNNVLAPILMGSQLVRLGALDDQQHETVAVIEAAARRGADMVRGILSFSTGAAIRRDDINVSALFGELSDLLTDTMPPGVELRIEPGEDDVYVTGDSTQLLQVLTNLCVNSRDSITGAGVVTVTARRDGLAHTGAGGETLEIVVTDTGSGMSADTLKRLFEPFFTTKSAGSGTGLGLPMAAAIVRNHGGTLTAHSDGVTGSTMTVRLPLDFAGVIEHLTPDALQPSATSTLHGGQRTVLVVDDADDILRLCRQVLEDAGFAVETASDGEHAVDVLQRFAGEIDVVVSDISMPRRDGISLAAWVADHLPGLPVVLTSGKETRAGLEPAVERRVTDFLEKPFSIEALRRSVGAALETSLRGEP